MAGRVGRLVVRTMGEIISGWWVACTPSSSNPPLQLLNPKAECTLTEGWLADPATAILSTATDCTLLHKSQTNSILKRD